mgnify:CR=1 FL=1
MRKAFQMILAAGLLTALAGCARELTDANLREVKTDMTTKEVESILGPPDRIETSATDVSAESPTYRPTSTTRYIYIQGDRTVTLTFVGDRLIPSGISGSFDK